MTLILRRFPRATMPVIETLADDVRPLLAVANAGGFHIDYERDAVEIEQGSWTGVDLQAVQAAVTSAPAFTETLYLKAQVDRMDKLIKAAFLTVLDGVNIERARHSAAAITPSQFLQQVKDKLDTL